MKLTDKNLKNLVGKEKRYTIAVGDSLFLRITPKGCKSWVLRYSKFNKVIDITLGHFPILSIQQAKQLAHLKREELKIKPTKGLTFNDAYLLWKRKKKGRIKSYQDECQRIEKHLLPYLKNIQLENISAPMALNIVIKLDKKLPTLKRILMRLNEILNLAVCAGLLCSNPCLKLSRVFAIHTPQNRPYIPAEKLYVLFKELNIKNSPKWFHLYLIFHVWSMLRPAEIVNLKWSYIQDENVLVLPAEIMKKGRPHRVPLPKKVIKLLELIKKERKLRSSYIFPFGRGNKPLNKQYLSKWLLNSSLKGALCAHGLRATGRTWLRDQNIRYEIAEDCLAHLVGSATERAYLRGDFLAQRTEVMELYFNYVYAQYCAVCAQIKDLHTDL